MCVCGVDHWQGNGVCVYPTMDKYEGDWNKGTRHGLGVMWFREGGYYKGDVRACRGCAP
jgi:hypothetical protein